MSFDWVLFCSSCTAASSLFSVSLGSGSLALIVSSTLFFSSLKAKFFLGTTGSKKSFFAKLGNFSPSSSACSCVTSIFSRPKFSLFAISMSSFRFLAPLSSFSVVSLESALARRFSKFGNLLIFSPPLSISKICKSCIKVAFSNKFSATSSPKISFTSVLWTGVLVC